MYMHTVSAHICRRYPHWNFDHISQIRIQLLSLACVLVCSGFMLQIMIHWSSDSLLLRTYFTFTLSPLSWKDWTPITITISNKTMNIATITCVIKGLATSLWTSSSKRSRQASIRKAKGGKRWWTWVHANQMLTIMRKVVNLTSILISKMVEERNLRKVWKWKPNRFSLWQHASRDNEEMSPGLQHLGLWCGCWASPGDYKLIAIAMVVSCPTRWYWDFDADLLCSDVLMLWVMMAIVCLTIFKNILRGLKYKEFVGCYAELLM